MRRRKEDDFARVRHNVPWVACPLRVETDDPAKLFPDPKGVSGGYTCNTVVYLAPLISHIQWR